jgi:hypothetical protein
MTVTMADLETSQDKELGKISKGWNIAMKFAQERLQRVYDLDDNQLERAVADGRVLLETLCLFIHSAVKRRQYRIPVDFWRVLHSEYGIVVYPTALTEDIDVPGLGMDVTFTEAYCGHIVMFGRCNGHCPPPCPFHLLQEAPPAYQKEP